MTAYNKECLPPLCLVLPKEALISLPSEVKSMTMIMATGAKAPETDKLTTSSKLKMFSRMTLKAKKRVTVTARMRQRLAHLKHQDRLIKQTLERTESVS